MENYFHIIYKFITKRNSFFLFKNKKKKISLVLPLKKIKIIFLKVCILILIKLIVIPHQTIKITIQNCLVFLLYLIILS